MPLTLPLPVRVAAGLLATGLDRLSQLPRDLPALPVTVAGHAVRASMRVQQEIAELVGRGDELLAGITSRPAEHPAWARFDDEDGGSGGSPADIVDGTVDGTVDRAGGDEASSTTGRWSEGVTGDEAGGTADPAAGRGPRGARRTGSRARTESRPAGRDGAEAKNAVTGGTADAMSGGALAGNSATTTPAAKGGDHPRDTSGPPDMPGYDDLRLAQVRVRLRGLDADAVARLLDHERSGAARAGHLTLLDNRLTTLRADASGGRRA